MNKLYFGDNLTIMREMEDGFVDLIATDPPFNSGRNYNAFFTDSQAQKDAFEDIWQWDTKAQKARADIRNRAKASDTYKALNTCLKGYDLVLQNAVSGNKGAMRAYLAFMGPRLAEMHRLLRDTGSIYLHCDPTASHYLKGVMDAIWDQKNNKKNEYFRNEIVWHYRRWTAASKQFQKMHDILHYYTKTNDYIFTKPLQEYANEEYIEDTVRGMVDGKLVRLKDEEGNYITREEKKDGVLMHDVWHDINFLAPTDSERLSYPTQKPLALYERIIDASSKKGNLVMDPFCGCGTTIDAAHKKGRHWIGIDLTIIALDPIRQRLADRHAQDNEPLQPHKHYEIIGYPTNMQEVYKLVRDEEKRHDFANWAVTRIGLKPTKNSGDGGKDGVGQVMLWNPDTDTEDERKIIAEVKTGKTVHIRDVRAFRDTINSQEAVAGVFITLEKITKGMKQLAEDMGDFDVAGNPYPKLQFWQIDDAYFENPETIKEIIKLPRNWIRPRKKSERHYDDKQMELFTDNETEAQ